RAPPAGQPSDRTPRLPLVEPVEVVARGDACFAARAAVEIHAEGILLAAFWLLQRQQGLVILGLGGQSIALVQLREAGDGGERLLLLEVDVKHRQALAYAVLFPV